MVAISEENCRVGLCGVAAIGIACPAVARAIFNHFPIATGLDQIDELLEQDLEEPLFGNAFVGADYRREVAPAVIQRAADAAACKMERLMEGQR
jgi:hypothetical protein